MKKLSGGGGGWSIIAADYSATGRRIATFIDLAGAVSTPASWWLTEPPAAGATGADMVASWSREASSLDSEVLAVAGFCSGAVFAAEISTALASVQAHRPRLLLFDPEHSSDDVVLREFGHIVGGKLADALTGAQREAVLDGAAGLVGDHHGTALAGRLGRLLEERARPGLLDLGMGERMVAELCATVTGYLTYLGGAAELDATAAWRDAVVVSSATDDSGLDRMTQSERSAAVAYEYRLPIGYPDLLRAPETAALVDRWLGDELARIG